MAGLERESAPPGVASILAIDDATIRSLSEEVLEALMSSAEWQRYSEIVDALTDEDVEILDAERTRVGVLLNPKKSTSTSLRDPRDDTPTAGVKSKRW
jgi:hypothetical protein